MANVQPNQYVLNDEDLTVTYTLLDPNNPTFTYADGTQTRNFSGSGIRVMHTEIGKLVTVTTRLTVDTGSQRQPPSRARRRRPGRLPDHWR